MLNQVRVHVGNSIGTDTTEEHTKRVDQCISDDKKERTETEHAMVGGKESASQQAVVNLAGAKGGGVQAIFADGRLALPDSIMDASTTPKGNRPVDIAIRVVMGEKNSKSIMIHSISPSRTSHGSDHFEFKCQ